jgi:hypothetical protein
LALKIYAKEAVTNTDGREREKEINTDRKTGKEKRSS